MARKAIKFAAMLATRLIEADAPLLAASKMFRSSLGSFKKIVIKLSKAKKIMNGKRRNKGKGIHTHKPFWYSSLTWRDSPQSLGKKVWRWPRHKGQPSQRLITRKMHQSAKCNKMSFNPGWSYCNNKQHSFRYLQNSSATSEEKHLRLMTFEQNTWETILFSFHCGWHGLASLALTGLGNTEMTLCYNLK